MSNLTGNPACWPINCATGQCAPPSWSRTSACSHVSVERSQEFAARRKAEVLQYKNAQLTKKQIWSQLVRGNSHNKKKVWATQNDVYTNSNTQNLEVVPGAFILKCNKKQT